MYACYIDESGHCGVQYNENQPVEVVCGVITDISKLFKTQREHSEIIHILEDLRISVRELKGREIYRGEKSWHGVKYELRYKIIDGLLEWSEKRKCKFIVCPIDSKTFFHRKSNGCNLSNLLKAPYEAGALNVILSIERLKSGIKKNKGKTLVVLDEQHQHSTNIINLIESDLSFTDAYTGYNEQSGKNNVPRLNEIIDAPFFSKSHLSTVIQIADIAAFIVNRYLLLTVYGKRESYNDEIKQIEKWYSMIGQNIISYNNINPTSKDDLCEFYLEVRPKGWTAKQWLVSDKQREKVLDNEEVVALPSDKVNQN